MGAAAELMGNFEILDIYPDGSTNSSQLDHDIPPFFDVASQLVLDDGSPLICGGVTRNGTDVQYRNDCLMYDDQTGDWIPGPTMQEERRNAAVVRLPGGGGFWLVGGKGGRYHHSRLITTEVKSRFLMQEKTVHVGSLSPQVSKENNFFKGTTLII